MRAAGSPPLRGYPRPIRRPRPTLPGFPLSLSPSFQDTARAATKKKWFQVIRFPASPTTGMHGTELRVQERRTFRLSAPLKPFSPAPGSMLRDCAAAFYLLSSTEPVARNGLSLASNGCRLSAASIPGSTFLACYFAPCLKRFPARSALLLHHLRRFAPVNGNINASGPLQFCLKTRLAAPPASTPLWDSYI